MANMVLQVLPVPRACGLCGRPTTQYSAELAMAYCGREEPPADPGGHDAFASPMRGGHPEQGPRRRRFFGRSPKAAAVPQEAHRSHVPGPRRSCGA